MELTRKRQEKKKIHRIAGHEGYAPFCVSIPCAPPTADPDPDPEKRQKTQLKFEANHQKSS
jgi:hypothetical protein